MTDSANPTPPPTYDDETLAIANIAAKLIAAEIIAGHTDVYRLNKPEGKQIIEKADWAAADILDKAAQAG